MMKKASVKILGYASKTLDKVSRIIKVAKSKF